MQIVPNGVCEVARGAAEQPKATEQPSISRQPDPPPPCEYVASYM